MNLTFGTPTQHKIIIGDTLEMLRTLPDASVHCCVTSPPYWGLRDYGHDGQIGLEATPEAYVARIVEVFREVRRVLRDDGTCWVNIGDSYSSQGGAHGGRGDNQAGVGAKRVHDAGGGDKSARVAPRGLKAKDLVGIPWRVAFALQADGWWLRQDIIWHKPNPMPESVRDRCTKAHEYVFLLTKSERYFYDAEAVSEAGAWCGKQLGIVRGKKVGAESMGRKPSGTEKPGADALAPARRNRRSVWKIATKPYKGAHFATMPPDLAKTCILAATSDAGCCSQCGKQFERVVERKKSFESGSGKSGNSIEGKQDLSGSESNSTPDVRMSPVISTQTLAWKQSCNCDASAVPCVVLDPFGGSGTTNSVAKSLGHDSIYIELNLEYEPLARSRIDSTKPGFLAS